MIIIRIQAEAPIPAKSVVAMKNIWKCSASSKDSNGPLEAFLNNMQSSELLNKNRIWREMNHCQGFSTAAPLKMHGMLKSTSGSGFSAWVRIFVTVNPANWARFWYPDCFVLHEVELFLPLSLEVKLKPTGLTNEVELCGAALTRKTSVGKWRAPRDPLSMSLNSPIIKQWDKQRI